MRWLALSLMILASASPCLALEWEYVSPLSEAVKVREVAADPSFERLFLGTDRGYRVYYPHSGGWLIREVPDPQYNYKVLCFLSNAEDSLSLLTGREDAGWYGYIMDNAGMITIGQIIMAGWESPPDEGPRGAVQGIGRTGTPPGALIASTAIFAAGYILRSLDEGETWESVHFWSQNGGASGMDLDVASNGDVIVGYGAPGYPYSNNGIIRSTDAGTTWQEISGDMPCAAYIDDVVIDPSDPEHMFVRQGGTWEPDDPALGVYETTDGGGHWEQVVQGNVYSMSMHPLVSDVLVAIMPGAILLTMDGGDSWGDVTEDLPWVTGLEQAAICPWNETLYVADADDGMWAMDLVPTGVGESPPRISESLRVHPNPFNPSTDINFALRRTARASLEILDIQGRHVRQLLDHSVQPAGESSVPWDGRDDDGRTLSSGVYLARLVAGSERSMVKLVLMK